MKFKKIPTSGGLLTGSDSSSYKSDAKYGFDVVELLLVTGTVLQCNFPTTASKLPLRALLAKSAADCTELLAVVVVVGDELVRGVSSVDGPLPM